MTCKRPVKPFSATDTSSRPLHFLSLFFFSYVFALLFVLVQDKPVRFRVKSENLMRSAYVNMNASLGGDASASGGVAVGGYPGGYTAQPYPGKCYFVT